MSSISSMIALIVVLLATCTFSAPVVPEFENATAMIEDENATTDIQIPNIVIFARHQNSTEHQQKRGNDTVGLSSSSEEDVNGESQQTTESLSARDYEDVSITNEGEQTVTEQSFSTEDNNKRDVEVELFESSTAVDETSTSDDTSSVVASIQVVQSKRTSDDGSWLAASIAKRSSDDGSWLASNSADEVQKRSFENIESSTDVDETSTSEDSSIPSTSEIINTERDMTSFSSWTTEATDAFNKRAIGSIDESSTQSDEQVNRRAAVSVASVEADEASTVVVLNIQPESTTDEQPSSSSTIDYIETTEVIRDESSSTSDYETTVVPLAEFTTPSSVPRVSTSKILAIIPGQVSRTEFVAQPITESPVVVERPVEQIQLNQVQNQTVAEDQQ